MTCDITASVAVKLITAPGGYSKTETDNEPFKHQLSTCTDRCGENRRVVMDGRVRDERKYDVKQIEKSTGCPKINVTPSHNLYFAFYGVISI